MTPTLDAFAGELTAERERVGTEVAIRAATSYEAFLASKAPAVKAVGWETSTTALPDGLSDHARAIVRWAVQLGRAAIFADTGLHKSRMQVAWLDEMVGPGESGLIFAPLAVAEQTVGEAAALGIALEYAEQQPTKPGLYITNYEKMHRFDPAFFRAVALDESSILKNITGKTREKLIRDWTVVPFRLACTATPSPNDVAELANHSEFLGVMTRREMLSTWFLHDDAGWRLKGHARRDFFRWMATWAVYIRRPSDLGFTDDGFLLPPLRLEEVQVPVEHVPNGQLFPALAGGIQGRTAARRGSLAARVAKAHETILATWRQPLPISKEQWVVWCGLNEEQDALAAALGEDCVSVYGSLPNDEKLTRYFRWQRGEVAVLLTKATMFGYGLNMQFCHRQMFLGLSDSFEIYYQAIRRCWRFGQRMPVDVLIVISDAEGRVVENVRRKESDHEMMAAEIVAAMGGAMRVAVRGEADDWDDYHPDVDMEVPAWLNAA